LKKVLIISYFFPPANFAGSYRIISWARYLHNFGIYPVIVTRCWNENQSELTDEIINNTFSHEKYETYEVYRIPYKRNLRDRIHSKNNRIFNKLISKFLTFFELVFQNYSNAAIPYSNLYDFSLNLIRKNKFDCLIVSGRPFQLFRFGWLMHKKTGIKWIADYRDEWSTCQWMDRYNRIEKFICKLEEISEKKWLSNSSAIVSCSIPLVNNISTFTQKPGYLVYNGFDPKDYEFAEDFSPSQGEFTIVYNGTLYYTQEVEVFLEAFKSFVDKFKEKLIIKLKFPGLKVDSLQSARVESLIVGYESFVEITSRVSKKDVIEIQRRADLLLMLGHTDVVGNFSSKIFEYLACRRPILLCPSDNDVLHLLINVTKSGYICQNKSEALETLTKLAEEKLQKGILSFNPDEEEVNRYTRTQQTKSLAQAIVEVCPKS